MAGSRKRSPRPWSRLKFRVFPEVDRSLSRWASVREHCVEYVRLLHEALESVHREDCMAHLDVRIENTCFSVTKNADCEEENEYKLLLIDFERTRPVADPVGDLGVLYGPSNFYRARPTWTCGQVDFKQLGILIALVLDEGLTVERPLPEGEISSALQPVYPLLCALIERGEWDQAAFDAWRLATKSQQAEAQSCTVNLPTVDSSKTTIA